MIVFHLAIPTHDLDSAEIFYTTAIGAKKARRYDDRVTFNFFEHQVVCHLSPDKISKDLEIYPRHFGITFTNIDEYEVTYNKIQDSEFSLLKERFTRWPEKPEAHDTFFVADPSNNILEFKHYQDSRFVY